MGNFKWGAVSGAAAAVFSVALGIAFDVNAAYIFLRALIFGVVFFGVGLGVRMLIDRMFPELLFLNDDAEQGEKPDETQQMPGSRINITLDNSGEYAIPEVRRGSDALQEIGNIEDLVSGKFKPSSEGIDRKREEVYNNAEVSPAESPGALDFGAYGSGFQSKQPEREIAPDSKSFEGAPAAKSAFTPGFSAPGLDNDAAGLGGLPDLDTMAMAFSAGFGGSSSMPASPQPSVQFQPTDDIESLDSFQTTDEKESAAPSPGKNKPLPIEGDFSPQELAMGLRTVLNKDK
ncbi:MAG: hypothetical protein LBH16_10360 [Treponema sp.]|nr:hypothetical protein [Treponema sp.]